MSAADLLQVEQLMTAAMQAQAMVDFSVLGFIVLLFGRFW